MTLPLLDVAALAVLLVGLPAASLAQLRFVDGLEIRRVPAYVSSIATLGVIGLGAGLVGARSGGLAALGLGPAEVGPTAAWAGGLVVAGVALVVAFRELALALGIHDSPLLLALMPRTRRERAVFGALSVTAGVCEEVAYRGYALTLLIGVVGTLPAAVFTSLVFGLMHGYQGWLGVARTSVLGGLLAAGYLASGTLWAPVVAHAALDVVLGVVLADRLVVPGRASGVRGVEEI